MRDDEIAEQDGLVIITEQPCETLNGLNSSVDVIPVENNFHSHNKSVDVIPVENFTVVKQKTGQWQQMDIVHKTLKSSPKLKKKTIQKESRKPVEKKAPPKILKQAGVQT